MPLNEGCKMKSAKTLNTAVERCSSTQKPYARNLPKNMGSAFPENSPIDSYVDVSKCEHKTLSDRIEPQVNISSKFDENPSKTVFIFMLEILTVPISNVFMLNNVFTDH